MRLSSLIASSEGLELEGPDVEIAGIATDSREVKPGFLFIAIPGAKHDGRIFITDAIERGAAAILMPGNFPLPPQGGEGQGEGGWRVYESTLHPHPNPSPSTGGRGAYTFVTAPDIRRAVSAIAARFYPRQPETIAAITGTSGKTSVAQFTREIWMALGHKSASIGTLGFITAKETRYGSLTTPDAVALHRLLNESAASGITHLAMEASSHGLALHRLDHVRVKIAGFTNLSRDHLDYHTTMEDYFTAKSRLFTDILEPGATAVLNADIHEYEKLAEIARSRRLKVISYGKNGKEIRLIESKPDSKGQILHFELSGKKHEVLLPVIGGFQAWNALCALGLVIGGSENEDKAVAVLGKLTGVPGRLQLAGHGKNSSAVFVDYAHKPDALENVLKALRPHVAAHKGAKLGVIFGCGGNRDKGKRPVMGEIASRLADWVIVTDDNPRHEEPAVIRREILAGCAAGVAIVEIGDRAEAIRTGIGRLHKGDVLVIAGKGHEPGQIVGDRTLPFDDADVAMKALEAR